MISIYLDDDGLNRPTPNGYQRAYQVDQLIKLLNQQKHVATISLDNDLGNKLDGLDFVKMWLNSIAKGQCHWQIDHIILHSANPIAVNHMYSLINQARRMNLIKTTVKIRSKLYE